MPNGTYGGVRGRKTKVGRKLSFSSYSISAQHLVVPGNDADIGFFRKRVESSRKI